jgi:hypothetical protein
MRMEQSGPGYLKNLTHIKKLTSLNTQRVTTVKIYFLVSEPLVRRTALERTSNVQPSIKSKINF